MKPRAHAGHVLMSGAAGARLISAPAFAQDATKEHASGPAAA